MSSISTEQLSTDAVALRYGAALQQRPDHGVLLLSDSGAADFLQRMTSNDVTALKPGESAVTVLTSDVARNLFAITVVRRPDDLLLLTGRGEADALAAALRGKIFFMDKVQVANISEPVKRLRLMGSNAAAVLNQLGFDLADSADGRWERQGDVTALKQLRFDVPGFELIIPESSVDELIARLGDAGATLLKNDAAYDALRIELGRPMAGAEITDAYNPLESGLAWACAENKGCYTGQEIIARQITYDKVTKTLVGLRSDTLLAPGASVTMDGRSIGALTSAAFSPTLNAPIALAIIKRPYNEPGSQVLVDETPAEVVALPFVDEIDA